MSWEICTGQSQALDPDCGHLDLSSRDLVINPFLVVEIVEQTWLDCWIPCSSDQLRLLMKWIHIRLKAVSEVPHTDLLPL